MIRERIREKYPSIWSYQFTCCRFQTITQTNKANTACSFPAQTFLCCYSGSSVSSFSTNSLRSVQSEIINRFSLISKSSTNLKQFLKTSKWTDYLNWRFKHDHIDVFPYHSLSPNLNLRKTPARSLIPLFFCFISWYFPQPSINQKGKRNETTPDHLSRTLKYWPVSKRLFHRLDFGPANIEISFNK